MDSGTFPFDWSLPTKDVTLFELQDTENSIPWQRARLTQALRKSVEKTWKFHTIAKRGSDSSSCNSVEETLMSPLFHAGTAVIQILTLARGNSTNLGIKLLYATESNLR